MHNGADSLGWGHEVLLLLGLLFLLGLIADVAARHSPLPRVTLLILTGFAIGPAGVDLLPANFVDEWFGVLTQIALSMVGFLLGEKLTAAALRERGRTVVGLTLAKVGGAGLLVFVGLLAIGTDPVLALVLAGVAPATAPAATYDVVRETGARGPFVDTLLSIVALDDALGLVLFAFLLAAAVALTGANGNDVAVEAVVHVLGSLTFGALLGVPMAFLTGRLGEGEPMLAEAVGFVLVCGGGALAFGLSPILAAMSMGSVVASIARHHQRPFSAIAGIEWPFMILFFILAGAALQPAAVGPLLPVLVVYLLARTLGTWVGTWAGARLLDEPEDNRRWMGLALLPQAGVALGMALLAAQRLPAHADAILAVVLTSTVLLELFAPVLTRRILRRVGAVPTSP